MIIDLILLVVTQSVAGTRVVHGMDFRMDCPKRYGSCVVKKISLHTFNYANLMNTYSRERFQRRETWTFMSVPLDH